MKAVHSSGPGCARLVHRQHEGAVLRMEVPTDDLDGIGMNLGWRLTQRLRS